MTHDTTLTCECKAHGIPDGYMCGKPDCPRTIAAVESLSKLTDALGLPKPVFPDHPRSHW